VDAVHESGADAVLDIDVPANRPDCLGHLGVARELSAATGVDLTGPGQAPEPQGEPTRSELSVEIDDAELCPRYTAKVIRGVKLGPSPAWVVQRLESCGLRSVSNVVDASNLVLLELGQPIHFFDLARLEGARGQSKLIRVRRAQLEERLRTLDGVERGLDPDMLVIADARRAVALAGVIGGADTEIGAATRDVLVEAARFSPTSIRSTSRRLGLQTDASFRFERGGDREGPIAAQALAARLLAELAGGRPAPGLIDACPVEPQPRQLTLNEAEIERLLGFRPESGEVRRALETLQLSPAPQSPGAYRLTIPTFRSDLEREADLVEEVARHLGYDRVPTTMTGLPAQIEATVDSGTSHEEQSRDLLAHLGFHEALSYAMVAAGEDDGFVLSDGGTALALTNPIAEPLARLRRSILPGLLRAVELNFRRGNRDLRLFESGRVFLAGSAGEFPREPLRLGIAWSGCGEPRHWSRGTRDVDLYDLIGTVERLLATLAPESGWERRAGGPAAFHPAQSVRWETSGGAGLAWGGALHPERQARFDQPVFLAEVELDAVALMPGTAVQHSAVSRLPAVARDLALVLTEEQSYASVLEALRSVEPPAPVDFEAVDRYEGPPLDPGEASLTVRVNLRPCERTLTDPETEGYRRALVRKLEESLGVRIRT
jgi:phenylalanyl-tRNA synthetase beta chain